MNIQEILKHLSTRNVNDTHSVFCEHSAHIQSHISGNIEPRIVFLSTSLFAWTEKYMQNYVRIPILKNSDVYLYLSHALSLKVTAPSLPAAVGVLFVNPKLKKL